jgi:malate dehydrogenase (oxaloacetate-decarboxylating)(NADP+)
MTEYTDHVTDQEALRLHASGRPGKIEIHATKPLVTQRDLAMAYTPGVAAPCLEIARDPALAYDYTAKGNMVAVVTNGTAVLGLGDLGPLGAKPVMEGKVCLFKRFADIDGIDLELDTKDVDEFVNCARFLGSAFGGINLEDIKAPECFVIEQRLRELMDIPVFHDDQHGTAIITLAAFINALDLTDRPIKETKVVFNGAGAASIACIELFIALGLPSANIIMCDTRGVVYQGREGGMNQWKAAHAADTKARTLAEAMVGSDVFVGLSVEDAVDRAMVDSMAEKPIVFAMANPVPEIVPDEVKAVRPDAIAATGRSDFPNQINNVLGFPYIFRGALDARASTINDAMKIAAAQALADLAREDVPDEVDAAYAGRHLRYGPEYIIPAPFDPRLIQAVPAAVAKAAMDSGVARRPIIDMKAYCNELAARLDPTAGTLQTILDQVRENPKRVVFAEGEEEKSIRSAIIFRNSGYGAPVLIGRERRIKETLEKLGMREIEDLEIHNAKLSDDTKRYMDFLYERLRRKGFLYRDCQRLVNQDRNVFAACMVVLGDADAMVTGLTRNYHIALDEIARVIDPIAGEYVFGLTMLVTRERAVFVADSAVHYVPTPEQIADISAQAAKKVRELAHEPRVALMSFADFGHPMPERAQVVRDAVALLEQKNVDFEFDGEMNADVALDFEHMKTVYPFCRLTGPANVLIMPSLNAASISSNLMQQLGGGTVIGPLLTGLTHSAQIVPMGVTVSDMVNMAALAAHGAK